ncbi:hypothetical protein CEXT_295941 [Caerostris extrusa]|uniref:Uncharacterized protein n=1 Tax=Caerostris extrusa TaxID=172846 RepID=A0AAV4UX52_CAEEX|nr:hypothetical protein CEXT_295941 [Caerostris extrusa]
MSSMLRVTQYRMKTLITSTHHKVCSFPAAQHFENSDCTSGVKTLLMPFFNTAYTNAINPVEQPRPNHIELMQHDPNLSLL